MVTDIFNVIFRLTTAKMGNPALHHRLLIHVTFGAAIRSADFRAQGVQGSYDRSSEPENLL